jgi:hypothetical protein
LAVLLPLADVASGQVLNGFFIDLAKKPTLRIALRRKVADPLVRFALPLSELGPTCESTGKIKPPICFTIGSIFPHYQNFVHFGKKNWLIESG